MAIPIIPDNHKKDKKEHFLDLCSNFIQETEFYCQSTFCENMYASYKSDPEFMQAYGMFLDWRGEYGQFILTNAFGITEKEVLEPEKYWKEHQD